MTWQGFLLGIILGVAVGLFHDCILIKVQKRQENKLAKNCTRAILACFLFRSLTVIIIFLLIYRNLGLLVGTAAGLIIVKKAWLTKEYLTSKKRLKK